LCRKRLLGCGLTVAAVLAGCGGGGGNGEEALLVLLTDQQLLRVSDSGETSRLGRLGPVPASASRGSLLAASADGETAYALVRGRRQHVARIPSSGGATRRIDLPHDTAWRRLAVGPRTGRLYLAGNVAGERRNELGAIELGVRLLVLSPEGSLLERRDVRAPEGRDWYVSWLTVARDESSVLVGYHGTDTTGADLVELDPLRICRDRTPAWGACLAHNHGRAEWVGDEILAATGERELALLDRTGRVVRELDSGLRSTHLMEFALTDSAAYAFGDCVKGSGVARVPFDGSEPRRLPGCGDVGALLGESILVLGRRWARDPYGRGRDASLAFVDLERGEVVRTLALPEDPADVLAVR
jgi:hypothetical protein